MGNRLCRPHRSRIIASPAVLLVACFYWLSAMQAASGQEADYFSEDFNRFENHIYAPNIRTVVFEQEGHRLSEPVLDLGDPTTLKLSFDDLDGDYKYYSYTLIHCNADWTPSSLLQSDYLEGFAEDKISDYKMSFNTIRSYTHYELTIPGREVKPIISGNYLVKIYPEGQPDHPVITRRMLVTTPKVLIDVNVHRATVVQDRDSRQEVDFTINTKGLQIANPFNDIHVVLMQNGRWDNAITNLKPLFLKDNLLDYSYDEENSFNGGNEFRTFDTRTMRIYTQYVKEILRGNDGYTVVLMPVESRSFGRYVFENDINGKFLIRNQDGRDDDLESEYVKVKFTFKHEVMADGNFYVFGGLSDWETGPGNKMTYNYDESCYELLMELKQGYYDYELVFRKDGSVNCDETIAEGNHFETVNDYTVLAYYRPSGGRYDQLIGIRRTTSR